MHTQFVLPHIGNVWQNELRSPIAAGPYREKTKPRSRRRGNAARLTIQSLSQQAGRPIG